MRMCPISTFPLWKAVTVSSAGKEMLQAVEARLGNTSKGQPLLESPKNTLHQKKKHGKMCLGC